MSTITLMQRARFVAEVLYTNDWGVSPKALDENKKHFLAFEKVRWMFRRAVASMCVSGVGLVGICTTAVSCASLAMKVAKVFAVSVCLGVFFLSTFTSLGIAFGLGVLGAPLMFKHRRAYPPQVELATRSV